MANIFEHPSLLAAEALMHLEDALVITSKCAKDVTAEFTTTANGWKVGDTASFRTHGEYEVKEFGGTIETQPVSTSKRVMTIEKFFDVSVNITAREEKMDFDSFSEQVLRPAVYEMAEKCDVYVGSKITQAHGLYASANLLASAADVALARRAANLQQLDPNRFCLVDDEYEAILLGQTWFNQSQTRGGEGVNTLQTGNMGKVMGMNFDSTLAFPTTDHTTGNGTTTTNTTVGTTNNIGDTSLVVDATTNTFNAGDHILVGGQGPATDGLRRPMIVATTTSAGATTIPLVDPITEVVPDGVAVSVISSGSDYTVHGAIFDSQSLAVGFPMLELPQDRVAGRASNNGYNMRIVKGYDLTTKSTTMSIDMLAGAFALDPRRITLLADS